MITVPHQHFSGAEEPLNSVLNNTKFGLLTENQNREDSSQHAIFHQRIHSMIQKYPKFHDLTHLYCIGVCQFE